MAEPKMLPSELLRALKLMAAEEAASADEAGDFNSEGRFLARAAVLREAVAVIERLRLIDGSTSPGGEGVRRVETPSAPSPGAAPIDGTWHCETCICEDRFAATLEDGSA